jgi:riboflavin biosynthesis pyrimidine reductase
VLDAKPKYVVSGQEPAPGWNTSGVALGPNAQDLAALKGRLPGNLLLIASPRLAAALVQAGLVDEYHLATQPIVAGRGPTLLAGLSAPASLRLQDVKRLGSGVTINSYRLGGPRRSK